MCGRSKGGPKGMRWRKKKERGGGGRKRGEG